MGIARAAINKFISLSQDCGISEVTVDNAVHPAMEHILETEGFKKRDQMTLDRKWDNDSQENRRRYRRTF